MSVPLPTEVYYHIIQHAHRKANLVSLSLCCSTFRDEAQRMLFFYPILLSVRRQKQFVDAINSSPRRLGSFVRTFHLRNVVHDPQVVLSDAAIASALQAMTGLRRFGIDRYISMRILLEGCAFSLFSFTIKTHTLEQSDILYLLGQFLPTQRDLQHFAIPGTKYFVDETVPSVVICPKLDCLSIGSVSLAKVLLRRDNRPIRYLHWMNRGITPQLTVMQLNALQCLMFYIFRPNTDTSFTQHLTSLNLLELEIRASTVEMVLNEIRFLANIPLLEVFILRQFPNEPFWLSVTPGGDTVNTPTYLPIVQAAFALRVTLKYVDILEGKELGYRRWLPPDPSGHMQSIAVSTWTDVQLWRLNI